VFASYLNQRMEQRNQQFFTNNFIHRNMYVNFIRQNQTGFRSAKDFEQQFLEVLKCQQSINKYNHEYKRKLDIEQAKFTGKISSDAETASEMTSATKVTKKSALSRQAGMTPDLDGEQPFGYDGTINDRDGGFNPDPDREFDEEDANEE
jgi:hypothetical protein